MRIGLNTPDLQGVSNETAATSTHGKARPTASAEADSFPEDTVTISSLASRALQTPDIRHDQVGSLQQSVSDGSYELDPSAIAEAVLHS
ncbi:MAG TPA: flagellar biosynthesis anti-sigma factor FlgM [Terriglobales bacterium]|nr:flagellar biosynthesis anti-sigma factor FlgM [Terriglobales bacterium]